MTIRDQIQSRMIAALKAGDKSKTAALRFLYSQIKNSEIDAKHSLTDEETIKLLATEAKRRRESIEAYQKGGRPDLVEKEKYELSVIEEYLPKQLTDEELKAIITEVKSANPNGDFGTLMKAVMARVAGRAEGGKVAMLLKQNG